jgi:hypothetical protein
MVIGRDQRSVRKFSPGFCVQALNRSAKRVVKRSAPLHRMTASTEAAIARPSGDGSCPTPKRVPRGSKMRGTEADLPERGADRRPRRGHPVGRIGGHIGDRTENRGRGRTRIAIARDQPIDRGGQLPLRNFRTSPFEPLDGFHRQIHPEYPFTMCRPHRHSVRRHTRARHTARSISDTDRAAHGTRPRRSPPGSPRWRRPARR